MINNQHYKKHMPAETIIIMLKKKITLFQFSVCRGEKFTLNKDTLPEDSANMYTPKEHQIRQNEHSS